jgi:hypothetical protein
MRNRFLSPCGFGRFLDVPLRSGSLFSSCHKFIPLTLLNGSVPRNSILKRCEDASHSQSAARKSGSALLPISQRRRFLVRAAFFAAAERDRAERCPATRFACFDNACLDADRWLSRLSARFVARERVRDGFLR